MGKLRIFTYNEDIYIIYTRYKHIKRYYIYEDKKLLLRIDHIGDKRVQEEKA